MPRPVKPRKISFLPENTLFVPALKRKCNIEIQILKFEEVEAMRLKDIDGLSQEECAKLMKVSRQTFQNIIDEARRKVAEALVKGMAIKIDGGNYTLNICKYRCQECETTFDSAFEKELHKCPKCESQKVECIDKTNFCIKSCSKRLNCIKNSK